MDINRFRNIIKCSKENQCFIEEAVKEFYLLAGMDCEKGMLNILQIARPLLQEQGYMIVEMPFSDQEIGALIYGGDNSGYLLLNSSLPEVNTNFALCHEIYHVFFQKEELQSKVEMYINEHYNESRKEMLANLFAGMLLMPRQSFLLMFHKFEKELHCMCKSKEEQSVEIIVKLMNYFKAPYMAVVIRCYELGVLAAGELLESLMNVNAEHVREMFEYLWLDESILDATRRDEYKRLELLTALKGRKYLEAGYINERAYHKALQNMRMLYEQIKGE